MQEVQAMLRGYTVPLSPTGKSGLVQGPPWYYAGTLITIEYEADVAAVQGYLPPGLQPSATPATCVAHFAEWQAATDYGGELLDPVRSQYKEFFILIPARHGDEEVFYCPYIYVTQDVSLVRGQAQGLPKKLGSVHFTRVYGVENPAASNAGAGGVFGASLAANDRRLVDAALVLEGDSDAPAGFGSRPVFGMRHVPDLSAGVGGVPLCQQLVRLGGRDLIVGRAKTGNAKLQYHSAEWDELSDLRPIQVGQGYRFDVGLTVDGLHVIHNI
jgi:hypothetical protein